MKKLLVLTLAILLVFLVGSITLGGADDSPTAPNPGGLVSGPDTLPTVILRPIIVAGPDSSPMVGVR